MLHRILARKCFPVNGFHLKRCKTFGPIDLPENLSESLQKKGIVKPTEIQEKAMKSIFEGNDVIINSETGSGKTLCYLLPMIMRLQQSQRYFQHNLISSARTLIFAPTTELLHQIGAVCRDLGINELSVAHDSSPLNVNEETLFILTTPKYLMNYDWRDIKNIRCIVFDEADLMFITQLREVRKLFEYYTGSKIDFSRKEKIRRKKRESKRKYIFKQAEMIPQFVFAGATMPHGGRKTILSLLDRFVPGVQLIQTEMVHKIVNNTNFEFIELEDSFYSKKLVLTALLEQELSNSDFQLGLVQNPNLQIKNEDGANCFRAIVFVNEVSTARRLFKELKESNMVLSRNSKYLAKNSYLPPIASNFKNDAETNNDAIKSKDIDDFDVMQFVRKWHESICILHSGLTNSERLSVMEGFVSGKYNMLITTGIAARGLDIPKVNLVVQFDFPLNVADILHRAGRTGRAGEHGKVISFISRKNQDLCKLFRSAVDKDEDVTHLFSRRRRLRRRIKAGRLLQNALVE